MCGPSATQERLENEQADFYSTLQTRDQAEFGEQQAILQQMQSVYAPILQRGPNQYGFTPAEDTDLNTQATEGTARNFAQASRALRESQAAQGGGDTFLPSGVTNQQEGELANSAEQLRSDEQLNIKQAGYAAGAQKFRDATAALETSAGLANPNAGADVANNAGKNAADTANTIAAQSESWMAPLAGVVGAVGGAAAGGYTAHH